MFILFDYKVPNQNIGYVVLAKSYKVTKYFMELGEWRQVVSLLFYILENWATWKIAQVVYHVLMA